MKWYTDETIKNVYYRDSFLYKVFKFFFLDKYKIQINYYCDYYLIQKGYIISEVIFDSKLIKIYKYEYGRESNT